jgi:predicted regulator of Ras-like GTPase activity (Roadblock/LC7/MglB family)
VLPSTAVDTAQAIADLTEISSQIRSVVLFDRKGSVMGSNLADDGAAGRFAAAAQSLLAAADEVRAGGERLTQLEAETEEGSVFVVRDGDRLIAATTGEDPTVGLVFYDLKSCLRASQAEPKAAKRKPAARKPRARSSSSAAKPKEGADDA